MNGLLSKRDSDQKQRPRDQVSCNVTSCPTTVAPVSEDIYIVPALQRNICFSVLNRYTPRGGSTGVQIINRPAPLMKWTLFRTQMHLCAFLSVFITSIHAFLYFLYPFISFYIIFLCTFFAYIQRRDNRPRRTNGQVKVVLYVKMTSSLFRCY